MNNINLINKKKKFNKTTSHGDIIGNTDKLVYVDSKVEKKVHRPSKKVGFKNGQESKTVQRVGRKMVKTPYNRPTTGDNTILNPKPEPLSPQSARKKREYPKPEKRREESRRRYVPHSDRPKDHWVYDPTTSDKYNTPTKGKKIEKNQVRRNVLTGHSSDSKDMNGLGILPSVEFTKTMGVVNKDRSARRSHGVSNRSSVSHNILKWE